MDALHLPPKLRFSFNYLHSHLIHPHLDRPHSPPPTASRSNEPFFHNSPTGQTDTPTNRQTDRQVIWHDASRSQWQALAAATQQPRPLRCRTPSASAADRPTVQSPTLLLSQQQWRDRQISRQTEWNDNKAHSLRTWRNRQTDRQTDRPTDRWVRQQLCANTRLHVYYCIDIEQRG